MAWGILSRFFSHQSLIKSKVAEKQRIYFWHGTCYIYRMLSMLICSGDPLFNRNLYSTMRHQGYHVDTVDRTASAVQKSFSNKYNIVIIDSDAIGLSASHAAEVILRSCETTRVVIVGGDRLIAGTVNIDKPSGIEGISQLVRSLCEPSLTRLRS